jgi:hypothetical protein
MTGLYVIQSEELGQSRAARPRVHSAVAGTHEASMPVPSPGTVLMKP